MAAPIECSTDDKLEYQFFPNNSGFQQFRVRCANDAHIALTTGPFPGNPMYEIFLGGWGNSKTIIRRNQSKPDVAEADTPGIVNGSEFRGFWVRWGGGQVSAGREGESAPFISYADPNPFQVSHVGVCTGWGACGNWILDQAQQHNYGGSANYCWVGTTGGNAPAGATQGGNDHGEPMYIARAQFQGSLTPGKLVPSHGCCYIPWGGTENAVSEYEVLCSEGGNPRWIRVSGGSIPPQAVPGGQTEEGEPLFVGRVEHDGSVTVGKVQPSHGVCYIPYGGQELGFPDYEILVG